MKLKKNAYLTIFVIIIIANNNVSALYTEYINFAAVNQQCAVTSIDTKTKNSQSDKVQVSTPQDKQKISMAKKIVTRIESTVKTIINTMGKIKNCLVQKFVSPEPVLLEPVPPESVSPKLVLFVLPQSLQKGDFINSPEPSSTSSQEDINSSEPSSASSQEEDSITSPDITSIFDSYIKLSQQEEELLYSSMILFPIPLYPFQINQEEPEQLMYRTYDIILRLDSAAY